MRALCLSVLAVLCLAPAPRAQQAPREIRVISPGVITNAGLRDFAASFEKETGTKVTIVGAGMGRIVNDIKTVTPPGDVIMLPFELMASLSLDGGVKPGTFTPLGRSEMGLAVPAGKPHPDISTVEKLAAVLKSAKAVMRSNPAGGSMVASSDSRQGDQPAGVRRRQQPGEHEGRRRTGAGPRRRRHGHSGDLRNLPVQGDRAGRPAAARARRVDRHVYGDFRAVDQSHRRRGVHQVHHRGPRRTRSGRRRGWRGSEIARLAIGDWGSRASA